MKIRNNQSANTSVRYVKGSRSALAKSLEKLASGYTINRAADDAAGLAISEKMRGQIAGLVQADKNSQDGAKLIQIGEGALEEIHDMLNRAAALAEQSANGTYNDELDRKALQKELDELCADIDRIAESANFSGIKLFQNKGLEYEGKSSYAGMPKKVVEQAVAAGTAKPSNENTQSSTAPRTLDDLLEGQEKGELNIVYFEDPMSAATQTPGTASAGASDPSFDIDIGGTKISEILKKSIVPQTVKNILTNYPAFSYLKDSAIGIGMRLYSDASSSVLASVTLRSSLDANGIGSLGYTLSVNMGRVDTSKPGWREDLEATISHEMIHAFMDEATTAGMTGMLPGTNSLQDVGRFESWFIEGMAQTASGPDNWVRYNGALQISENSTDDAIKAQIQAHKLGAADDDSAADYGTGYLACMYLGWAISSGGNSSVPVTAENISKGLSALMNEVISGKSLDTAIKELTNNKFASTSAFKTAFNDPDTEITGFVRDLMVARGAGRGGLASGNLSDTDLTNNAELSGVTLFELNTSASMITNKYPAGYVVLTGGTTSINGTAPSDFNAAVTGKEYGDFVIKGNLPSDSSGGVQGITWDDTNKILTVTTGNDIEISMKSPTTGVNGNIVLNGSGNVTLDGVNAASLDAKENTKVTYKGQNDIGAVTVDSGKNAVFQGEGQLNVTGTFTNNGTVSFNGGAMSVGDGTGIIGGTVNIDKASVAASITSPKGPNGTTALQSIDVDWSKLTGLNDIASITFDGTKSTVPLGKSEKGTLWLDPESSHRITFTDSNGVSKTLAAVNNAGTLEWAEPIKPFTVTGGTEGTDYHYEDDGTTLVIDTDAVTSISGGSVKDETGANLYGRIKIKDGIGAVNLELNGVNCSNNTVGSGFELGKNNTVTLTLKNDTENKFTGAANFAGISVGTGTSLTIDGDTGKLSATGGTNAAGIGRNGATSANRGTDRTSSITITGGDITAVGYSGGAGIGAGNYNDIGNITITGGTINSTGGNSGGAGIGGANYASCGDITINESSGKSTKITAISEQHGAGIGGGWWDTSNGAITISAGEITAQSKYHGTGIGAGCQGGSGYKSQSGQITITGTAVIKSAIGGDYSAGIGASNLGTCEGVEISGDATIEKARGGNNGAGIGSGYGSKIGNITINTTGTVNAQGGNNGVGIGSGYGGHGASSCGNIEIKQGTVTAKGGMDSTGIGAGRGSTSGNIAIGDKDNPNNKVVVTAEGGMTYNGGNIMSYSDSGHTQAGTVTITGNGTSVRPGDEGEGLYSTSGVVGADGKLRYAYPVYLFEVDGNNGLDAGVGLNAKDGTKLLPLDKNKVKPGSITITSDKGGSWIKGLSHEPQDSDYVFVWLTPENQKLTITYEEKDGAKKTVDLDLIYYPNAGVFRIETQPKPADAIKPEYSDKPGSTGKPGEPGTTEPEPEEPEEPEEPKPEETGKGGIILQIGAEYGETLEVPQFYLSLEALGMENLDISTQPNAWEAMPVIKNAINRVSSIRGAYGALYNRLEHNQRQLQQSVENTTDAESCIRDADVAKEMMRYTKSNILLQSAQAMLAQANQLPQTVLQMLS